MTAPIKFQSPKEKEEQMTIKYKDVDQNIMKESCPKYTGTCPIGTSSLNVHAFKTLWWLHSHFAVVTFAVKWWWRYPVVFVLYHFFVVLMALGDSGMPRMARVSSLCQPFLVFFHANMTLSPLLLSMYIERACNVVLGKDVWVWQRMYVLKKMLWCGDNPWLL